MPRTPPCRVRPLRRVDATQQKKSVNITLKALNSLISGSRPFWPCFPSDYWEKKQPSLKL